MNNRHDVLGIVCIRMLITSFNVFNEYIHAIGRDRALFMQYSLSLSQYTMMYVFILYHSLVYLLKQIIAVVTLGSRIVNCSLSTFVISHILFNIFVFVYVFAMFASGKRN